LREAKHVLIDVNKSTWCGGKEKHGSAGNKQTNNNLDRQSNKKQINQHTFARSYLKKKNIEAYKKMKKHSITKPTWSGGDEKHSSGGVSSDGDNTRRRHWWQRRRCRRRRCYVYRYEQRK
jgi:hypothetical protein